PLRRQRIGVRRTEAGGEVVTGGSRPTQLRGRGTTRVAANKIVAGGYIVEGTIRVRPAGCVRSAIQAGRVLGVGQRIIDVAGIALTAAVGLVDERLHASH